MYKNIFITYNQESEFGQNTALRLQTISNLYDLSVFLPSRLASKSNSISSSTKDRIKNSSLVVAFGLEKLSLAMRNDLDYAIKLNKPIILINDKNIGPTIQFKDYKNINKVNVDFLDTDDALHSIADFLQNLPVKNKEEEKEIGLGTALLGVGIGLLALWALSGSDD